VAKSLLVDKTLDKSSKISVKPEFVNDFLIECGSAPIRQKTKLKNLLSRPQVSFHDLLFNLPNLKNYFSDIPEELFIEVIESAEIRIKYSGYINREYNIVDKLKRLENIKISDKFHYETILSLSTEARQKLIKIQPETIGQAFRIPGVSPNDINVLLILLGR
jgi:tRNA uridine 5-carboxymethylaminomethyl modification enzyme